MFSSIDCPNGQNLSRPSVKLKCTTCFASIAASLKPKLKREPVVLYGILGTVYDVVAPPPVPPKPVAGLAAKSVFVFSDTTRFSKLIFKSLITYCSGFLPSLSLTITLITLVISTQYNLKFSGSRTKT